MLLREHRTFYTLTERISGKNASCHQANDDDADLNDDKYKCNFPVISGQQMYKFLLKAKNPLGEVETNYTLNLYTRVYPYSPSKVTVLCTGSRQTKLFLSWGVSYKNMTCQFEIVTNNKEKQLGTIVKYEITWNVVNEVGEQSAIAPVSVNSTELHLNFSDYVISVRAVNSVGSSPSSQIRILGLFEDGFRPGVRYSISVYGCSQHKEYLLKKMVGYTQELGIKEVINITDPDVRNVTVTNLHSATYEFTVKAYTAGGEGIGEPININLVDSRVAEERVARQEPRQTGEADIWAEKFGVVIPPTEVVVELAREGLVELGRSSNPTFDVKPFIPDKVWIIESVPGKDVEDSDICTMEMNNGDNGSVNNLEVISDSGYKPQMRPHVPLLDVNHTPNPQHLDLPEQSEGYQPQLKVSNWSLESPEVDEASACIGSPTSVNSTQFLLPYQASEEGQSTRSSSWKFSSLMSSAQKR
ncbi:Leukemia inhibitory factor receptor [Acipenser ruthenus]|uniref:Leukemia inhibitory factor receptor n=1 Tax=Acipenser ruthenus TaxID=7906 RepID=A0A662YT35_ACIRT|nr:Leukemia inhibitory factor receptor [Acipenser ruthenus]